MSMNPKNVQKAVQLANALANPNLRDQDWQQLKDRFNLDDLTVNGIKILIDTCEKHRELKSVLSCLTFGI